MVELPDSSTCLLDEDRGRMHYGTVPLKSLSTRNIKPMVVFVRPQYKVKYRKRFLRRQVEQKLFYKME